MSNNYYNDSDRYRYDYEMATLMDRELFTARCLTTYGQKDMSYLWAPFLPKYGLVCLTGESDCGKSAFLMQLALAVATHEYTNQDEYLGLKFFCNRRGVLYIATEDVMTSFSVMLNKQCKELQIDKEQLCKFYILFQFDNIINKIKYIQETKSVGVIIIDTFNDILTPHNTSIVAVRSVLSKLQFIAEKHKCLIIISHHNHKKARFGRPSKYDLIGSPAIEAKARAVIELRTDPFEKNIKHLCVVKANYLPDKYKNKSFLFEFTPQLTFNFLKKVADFDSLTVMPDYISEKVQKYIQLRQEGVKGDELAKAMGFASRGSLSVWVKKHVKTEGNTTNLYNELELNPDNKQDAEDDNSKKATATNSNITPSAVEFECPPVLPAV